MRPRLLDLFCCEGGASRGYDLAGFDVYGIDRFTYVDKNGRRQGFSQKRYPYPSIQLGAIQALAALITGHRLLFSNGEALGLGRFDAIHASPPCQHASAGTRAMRARGDNRHEALIESTRDHLANTDKPYVIENVKGAALHDPITLCGTMFGLRAVDDDGTPLEMWRHRLFESNVPLAVPHAHNCRTQLALLMPNYGSDCTCGLTCQHGWFSTQVAGSYGGARRDKNEARNVRHGGYVPSKRVQQELLGIDWMTERGMHQALPPEFTRVLGQQLLAHVRQAAA